MTEFEFEIWQDGFLEASGVTNDAKAAMAEADHYVLMYAQDGPVEARFYVKQTATREELEQFAS